MDEVTLFITACNRPHLLKTTLESFVKFNTYPIKEAIIIEDSGNKNINDFVSEILTCPVKLIYNDSRLGQMLSIEKGYQMITTDYVFHCEEDWEFYDYSFIEKSFEILKDDSKITSVHLRSYQDQISCYYFNLEYMDKGFYNIVETKIIASDVAQAVFFWNPGLRRTSLITEKLPFNGLNEGTLGYLYHMEGKYAAVTKNKEGYVRHIGWDEHVW
jgi:Glycosyl transferase family 2